MSEYKISRNKLLQENEQLRAQLVYARVKMKGLQLKTDEAEKYVIHVEENMKFLSLERDSVASECANLRTMRRAGIVEALVRYDSVITRYLKRVKR